MADKVEINESELNGIRAAAKGIQDCLSRTHTQCKTLQSYVASAEWSGKNRDAFYTYLNILEQFHGSLHDISKKQVEALNNLLDYFDDYHANGEVRKVRNL
ncbi:hypothetical protein QR721_11715 [Aciduricibacillus chroicocephali]|uniref:WXG100 family type VII secretion target n=1 Tax=Aciduricibacillus chroicocephali TaxID=3054939 RepID=A0ABY9KUC1_9BACI|nr:hypothetical protein QR721_11715 [Bacillaceae bacterium 44XB]